MKYRSKLTPGFSGKSFCYQCFYEKNKNAILYEVNMTGHEIANKNYYLERRGYYTYLINYTLAGSGTLIYNGKKQVVNKGDLVFINCNDEHIFYPESDNWEFIYIHVCGLGVQFLYDSFLNACGNVFKNYPQKKLVKEISKIHSILEKQQKTLVENGYHLHLHNDSSCCSLSNLAYSILVDINEKVCGLKREMPFALEKALEYIRENYNKDLSLSDIAKHACMSKYHFERVFKQHLNTTVYQYIKDLRFQNARWLLETTNMSLIDISFAVGYSDIQALIKIFKKQLGVTPTEYRKSVYHY